MADAPLLTLTDISLGFGGRPLFSGVSIAVGRGERAALAGRNGSGKSTLLKIAAGLVEPDAGTRFVQPGVSVEYLPQEPDFTGFATLLDYAAHGLDINERHRAEAALDGLQAKAGADPASSSGGERRRAALARVVARDPDLMLLDEPTNHLDIHAIEWLEARLSASRAGFVLISHDRRLLSALSRSTLWLDRGVARRLDRGFDRFEDWRDKQFEEEDAKAHKLDRLIKSEGVWAVEGISARRKRNMGRVRRLAELRAERGSHVARRGPAKLEVEAGAQSGKLVIEAKGLSRTFGDRTIFSDFSIRVMRGDRVGLVGPNGAGKTTLLRLLTGLDAPDEGSVRLGTALAPVIFDQNREALDGEASLWETLTQDRDIGAGRSDQVMVRGKPRHVVGYLKDFLFEEAQARGPVKALSGGERARLLLAKLFARESNMLVLDEPTNDLDVETLDLLQEILSDYDGTALIVSHDRDFLDRVATSIIAVEGDGTAVEYAGGWSDYIAQRGARPGREGAAPAPAAKKPKAEKAEKAKADKPPQRPAAQSKLGFSQTRRLAALPGEMDRLGAEIARLEEFLADPELYSTAPAKFAKATEALAERRAALEAAEEEWLELEALREELEG